MWKKNVIFWEVLWNMDPFEIIIVLIGVLSIVDCKLHMSARKRKCLGFFQQDVVSASKSSPNATFSGESVTAFHYRYDSYDCT